MDNSFSARKLVSGFLAMLIIVSTFFVMPITSSAYSNKYSVTANGNFNMRKSASAKGEVIKTIKKGQTLYVQKNSSGNWVYCKDSSGKAGYVPVKHINKAKNSSVYATCKTTDAVNLRKGAGTSYGVITVVPKGTTMNISDNSNSSWTKVSYSGNTGYLSKTYINVYFKTSQTSTTPPATGGATKGPLTLKSTSASVYKGSYYGIQYSNTSNSKVKWTSSNSNVASVDDEGILYGKKNGSTTVKASVGANTLSCNVNVRTKSNSVNISNKKYNITSGKSVYLTSSTSGVSWSSSDTSVATVTNYGLVTTKKAGKAVIYTKTSNGWASCLLDVKGAEAVKFTYANPNSAPKNSTVTFVAITDKSRSAVKFEVTIGSKKYTVNATEKTASGNTYIWKGKKKLTESGKYKIVAYSKKKGTWSKSTGSYGKAFVTKVTSNTETSCEERHASNSVINFISNYEGLLSNAMFDPLTNFPCLTVGFGRVIYSGDSFYNGMTKSEAMAYLVDSVETDGYVTKVNNFLLNNKIKFNQRQFDSLVTLVYNCGTGILTNDSDIINMLLNTHPSSKSNPTKVKTTAKVAMKKSASDSAKNVKTVSKGATLKLANASIHSKKWYKVIDSSGNTGYINYKYLNVTSYNQKGTRDLNNIFIKSFISNIFCYHHAGGSCYAGLLYRRIDECEMFYYGDYTRDGEKNKNNFYYRCVYHNPSFGCG